MSSIAFASPSGSVSLSGAERAWMGQLVNHIALGVLDPEHNRDLLRRAVPPDHYLQAEQIDSGYWGQRFGTAMSVDTLPLRAGDMAVEGWHLCLNTALAVGSDAVKLAARLHAQCEIHAWVDGPNRDWLADLIESGRTAEVFRPNMGWEEVAAFLRVDQVEPVVTSYSVTDGFPHPPDDFVGDDAAFDAWFERPKEHQWAEALEALRAGGGGIELRPDCWDDFYFGSGVNAFRLLEQLRATELRSAQ